MKNTTIWDWLAGAGIAAGVVINLFDGDFDAAAWGAIAGLWFTAFLLKPTSRATTELYVHIPPGMDEREAANRLADVMRRIPPPHL